MKKAESFKRFCNLVSDVLKVPHSEIKEKLEAEKREKEEKKAAKRKAK
jgi:hypothetical protein